MDTLFAPKALSGARMVFGESNSDDNTAGSRLYLPVVRDGGVHLLRLGFGDDGGAGLFGNRQNLLDEWRARLSLTVSSAD